MGDSIKIESRDQKTAYLFYFCRFFDPLTIEIVSHLKFTASCRILVWDTNWNSYRVVNHCVVMHSLVNSSRAELIIVHWKLSDYYDSAASYWERISWPHSGPHRPQSMGAINILRLAPVPNCSLELARDTNRAIGGNERSALSHKILILRPLLDWGRVFHT